MSFISVFGDVLLGDTDVSTVGGLDVALPCDGRGRGAVRALKHLLHRICVHDI